MDDLTPNDRAVMGANHPPPFDPEKHDDFVKRTDAFMKASDKIKAAGDCTSDETAQLLADHIAGMRGLKKQVEEAKKAEKAPHDAAGKAVLAAYTPLEDRLDRAIKFVLGITSAWMQKKAAAAEAERLAKEAAAKAAAEEAERAAAAAAGSGSLDAELEAERLAEAAAKAQKEAAKAPTKVNVGSATGAGRTISQRRRATAELVNINHLFLKYRDHPKVAETLLSLANADARSGTITEENAKEFGVSLKIDMVAA